MGWFQKESTTSEHRYGQERLSAYLDNELAPGERRRVERHLEGCPQCRCELNNLRRTVQWTMELPVVPCPRSFTISVPVPARPVRVARRGWGMPVLQGATALVAVLFLVAVVGQFLMPRMASLPASAPQAAEPVAAEPEAVALAVEVTREVEVHTVQVELLVTAAPAAAELQEQPVAEAAKLASEPAGDLAATISAAPPGMGVGGEGGTVQTVEVEATLEAPRAVIGQGAGEPATATPEASATREPSPSPAPTATPVSTETPVPEPTLVPTLALAPTLVASAEEPAVLAQADAEPARTAAGREPAWSWLVVAEVALGAAFVLLGTLTALLMVRKLRRG